MPSIKWVHHAPHRAQSQGCQFLLGSVGRSPWRRYWERTWDCEPQQRAGGSRIQKEGRSGGWVETHLLLALQFHLETSALKILKSSIISISLSLSLFLHSSLFQRHSSSEGPLYLIWGYNSLEIRKCRRGFCLQPFTLRWMNDFLHHWGCQCLPSSPVWVGDYLWF